jgi:(R,R)-butanediol dehydrogenase/meso-butanediol dehydrogenase/diacetyl reductase
MELVRPRGTVVVAGLCMRPDELTPAVGILKQLKLQFVGAYGVKDFQMTVDALGSGDLSPREMISKIVSLDELPVAFEAMRRGANQCKLMVDPWGGSTISR